MQEFDIYTLGSGYYLEKIFNAIRLIIDGKDSFTSIMKFGCIIAIVALAVRAGINNDLKSAAKWFLGVTILVGLFLTSRATVHIHDTLPNSYGGLQAPRTVQNVPWGLAFLGSSTSKVGNFIAEKFDMAFAGVFVNSTYQETGMLFGSKIIEDISRLRIQDPNLKAFISKFYKRCMVPDLRMGHNRVNGYTIKDFAETDDILLFLKEHSSKARMIAYDNLYVSCNDAANKIYNELSAEITSRSPKLARSFLSYFFPEKSVVESNQLFESLLLSSYGNFIRSSSKDAKDILLQNVMINSLSDKVGNFGKSFGKVTTEATTSAANYSVAQMAQKFVPIYRAVLECILYGMFPLILILMVTPIGLEVLKNYSFGFIYLQMWQPMYAILFCIAGSWGKFYASDIGTLTFANHYKISQINAEISAIAGYMLASIPILSVFITKGMVSSMGSLASSVFYVQQSAAIQNAESAVRGNYQLGNTQVDTHSFNNTSGNKFDDNHTWMSGLKTFSMSSGAMEKHYTDGRAGIDSGPAISNLAGLAKIDFVKAIGSRFDQSIGEQQSKADRFSVSSVESAASGYSKILGLDQSFNESSQDYQNWSQNLTTEQRESIDEMRSQINRFAKNNNISSQDAIRFTVAATAGIGEQYLKFFSIKGGINSSTSSSKDEIFNKAHEISQDTRFSSALSKVRSFAISDSHQEGSTFNNSVLQSSKDDFHASKTSSYQATKAMDRVQNLQESKSRFEQDSSNISQDLSHKFAESAIAKFGAAKFDDMLRNDPKAIQNLLNQFVNENIGNIGGNTQQEYQNQKSEFNLEGSSLKNAHNQKASGLEGNFEQKNNDQRYSNLNNNANRKIKDDVITGHNTIEKSLSKKANTLNRNNNKTKKHIINKQNKKIKK
jgi:conjugal transfer mating pair stabilization protein TraG